MSGPKNSLWKREASSSFDTDDDRRTPDAPPVGRYSISASSLLQHALASKVWRLKDNMQPAKQDCLESRRESSELREHSSSELDRVARYLGVLAEETWKQDRAAVEGEAGIATLESEKEKLFFRLWTSEAEIFSDVQPLVQSALDGFNVSIFAYGQSHSGKRHTMEGSSHDRGVYARCFEELFDLANSDATATPRYGFSVTVFELHNEQVRDLVHESGRNSSKICMGSLEFFVELTQEKVDNPLGFLKVLKEAFQSRGSDVLKSNVSHLIVTIHISHNNLITGENPYSKLSLVDLAGSEGLNVEDGSGERVTELLHVMMSLSALGDVLSSLSSKKHIVPYENSTLTRVLADSLGTFWH
ncbi:kinesin-like protein KIN-14A [Syzygium oleosum]|uniref:kinesin-like protein KIN-14A n=1 Tax=Syzygium oleosum TaxID=219896 RepID=UPI0024BBE334|nr:kinesin-like protein KIN-14A [Syzygium oleosum]